MWTISEVKEKGKAAFKKNYWRCVLVAAILAALTAGSSMSGSSGSMKQMEDNISQLGAEEAAAILAFIASIFFIYIIIWSLLRVFVLNIVEVGCHSFLKENLKRDGVRLDELKAGFDDYKRSLVTILLRDIFLALWFCLLFIPGLIKSYSYMMVPYILKDEPELSAKEVITRSREMMNGHKWRAFLLDLSFIGWMLLSVVTCGIVGILYTAPYRRSSRAALYLKLRENA